MGGITLLIAQLLYLPNFAISALSYLSGAGFAISEGTLISPFIHRIDEIPAVPLLGALPNSTLPIASLSILVVLAMGAVVANAVKDSAVIAWTALCFGLFTLVIARAASGELISSNLPSVGPIWWLMPILLTVEFGVGALAVRTLPILLSRVRRADES